MDLVRQGEFQQAWEILVDKNPLPFSTSSVCQGFCEKPCNRGEFDKDEPVSINKIERFLGEMALEKGWLLATRQNLAEQNLKEQKKVAVIGSGPAGLSCAYQLARRGYWVVIFEALSEFGGLMRAAIPEDRLPKDILNKEINNILKLDNIYAIKHWQIDRKRFTEIRKNFDAVFVAVGAHKPIKLGIEGENAAGVIYGLDFLKKVNLGESVEIGKRVVIIGDGNTAIDCAHLISQMPDKEVFVFCEKSREEIPDFLQKGIKAADKYGAKFVFLFKVLRIRSQEGRVKGIIIAQKIDNKLKSESEIYTPADEIIIALGEEPDTSFIDKDFASEIAGIIFGGDPNNVASAIASGNEGVEKIIAYLERREQPNLRADPPSLKLRRAKQEIVESKDLNFAYFEHLSRNKKITDKETAIREAERCFSCGTCIGCGVCEQFCPDIAILISEKDKEPEIDKEHCKGCGICANECPRSVIKMEIDKKEEEE